MPRKNKKTKESGRIYLFRSFSLPIPLFIFLLLAAGVLLVGWTAEVTGLDFTLRAKVAASPVTQPAVIQLPIHGTTLSTTPTNVSGICPPGTYIKIFRNDIFAGSVLCSDTGNFEIPIDLVQGSNKLVAKDYNNTDDPGPVVAGVTVYYKAPVPSNPNPPDKTGDESNSDSGTPTQPSKTPVSHYILNTDGNFEYSGYFTGQTVELKLTAGGGVPPYTYDIDWGDRDPRYVINKDGPFVLGHTYDRVGEFHNSHIIKIYGTDAIGKKTYLQLFVIINKRADAVAGTTAGNDRIRPLVQSTHSSVKWLWVAWPAYAIVLLMSISYILGEREELFIISRRASARG